VNKNSFYKQKAKDVLPNKLFGAGSGIGGMGPIGNTNRAPSGNNRVASSYFNKNVAALQQPGALPSLGSKPSIIQSNMPTINKNSALGGVRPRN
jgi:hypothetical protein